MYQLGVIGLVAAYILTVLLLLSINLYSNWSWKVKAGSIGAAMLLYIVTYVSIPPLLGWPTSESLPQRFRLVAAEVLQPDKATGAKGKIYLWLKGLEGAADRGRPRAYELPYSSQLHEAVLKAKSKLDKGMQQLGEMKESMDPDAREVDTYSRMGQESVEIDFYDLPDPLIPEK